MKSENEILEALKILKKVCEENNGKCRNCLLRNASNECGVITNSIGELYNTLTEWDLKNFENPRLILN